MGPESGSPMTEGASSNLSGGGPVRRQLSKVAPFELLQLNLRSIAAWVESRPRWQLISSVLLLLSPAVLCAYWKPLTNDELFTFEVSRLGSVVAIWKALSAGADNHPPLDYLLRYLSMSVFGSSELAFRLPSLLACGLCLISIFQFVVRRASAIYGLVAVLIRYPPRLLIFRSRRVHTPCWRRSPPSRSPPGREGPRAAAAPSWFSP